MGVGKKFLGLAEGEDDEGQLTPKEAAAADDKVQVWLRKRGAGVEVVAQASPTEDVGKKLDELAELPGLSDEAKGLLEEARKELETARQAGEKMNALLSAPAPAAAAPAEGGAPAAAGGGLDRKGLEEATDAAVASAKRLADLLAMLDKAAGGCATGIPAPEGQCLAQDGRPLADHGAPTPIAEMDAGWRVWPPGAAARPAPDRESLRLYRLALDYGGGAGTAARLLRPPGWQSAAEGGVVWLDLPEMGAVGWARVLGVEACPALHDGPGPLVTGWFRHSRGQVYELRVKGSAEPLCADGAAPGLVRRPPGVGAGRRAGGRRASAGAVGAGSANVAGLAA